eukprot:TRINITY_DN77084_c0_g1_i1.p1 TRINITY_DN77084_c0_g1~~TRINITY_DN77084_c0_g1_i1.p1  ORF type:complete len:760 (+),score=108.84 TRINITY_DN77084_c0_g1_i1:58-2337(+)
MPSRLGSPSPRPVTAGGSLSPRPATAGAGERPSTNIIALSDPGQDLDDELSFLMMRTLVEEGFINLLGIVTTLHPSFDRARLCRGTLDLLGLRNVPVGVGSDGGDKNAKHSARAFESTAESYMPSASSEACMTLEPGRRLLAKLYTKAEDKSVTILVIASFKDLAIFLRDNEALFVEKTKEVVIQGGVKEISPSELLEPDTSNNLTFDKEAADFVFRRCQELGMRLVICSRWTAYAAKLPRGTYDKLAELGSSIGRRLRNAQRESIEQLWARAAVAEDDPRRKDLPARCDRPWFIKTFCGGQDDTDRTSEDSIWDLVDGFMQYDTLALLAAVPYLRTEFFVPRAVPTGGAVHLVIGVAEDDPNLQEPKDNLISFMESGYSTGIMLDHHFKAQVIFLGDLREDTHGDMQLSCLMLAQLIASGAVHCLGIIALLGKAKEYASHGSAESNSIRETLDEIGLHFVPVHIAEEAGAATKHLTELYRQALPNGVTVVSSASLAAIAQFAESDPRLFGDRTIRVIHMGGAARRESKRSWLQPDLTAQNNLIDMDAASRFYKTAQDLSVPLVVLSRFAAQAAQLPRAFFDIMKSHGGKVGQELCDKQCASFNKLWQKANAPKESPRRGSLAKRCDRAWFLDTFCDGAPHNSEQSIWDQIHSVNLYGPLTLLVALPGVVKRFFSASPVDIRATTHQVIGWSADDECVSDCTGLQQALAQCILYGCLTNRSEFSMPKIPPLLLPSGERVELDMSEAAMQKVIPEYAAYG